MESKTKFRIGICQIKQTKNKLENIESAKTAITEAVSNGAQIVVLGEYFNTMYNKDWTTKDAENIAEGKDTPTVDALREISKKLQIYLIAGSIPERGPEGKIFNACLAFNKEGEVIGKCRKIHFFDIDIPGQITYKESDFLIAGNDITVIDTEYCKIGLGICYDLRFPELSLLMTKEGAKVLVFPGCFNQTTGPLHWELLLRSRALDNQVYVVGGSTSRFREDPSMYQSWGHSACVDPMGKVIASCEEDPAIVYADVDLEYQSKVRDQLPYQKQKRYDVYKLEKL